MTQEQLKERIQKTEAKIAKIEKRISKWSKAQDTWELNRATDDLHYAQVTLEKYQNLLNIEIAKDNEFENNRIAVIWNFLLSYKDKVAQYIRDNMKVLNKYYEADSKACDWFNNHRHEVSKEEFDRTYLELRKEAKKLKANVHPYTEMVAEYNGYHQPHTVNKEKLEELLLKDCKERYLELVDQVTEITGIITDAINLSIEAGELNGIIIGEKGKAKVQTFSAGGYNIQCFHYRTRVDKIQ